MQYNSEPQDESTTDISTEVLSTGFLKKKQKTKTLQHMDLCVNHSLAQMLQYGSLIINLRGRLLPLLKS